MLRLLLSVADSALDSRLQRHHAEPTLRHATHGGTCAVPPLHFADGATPAQRKRPEAFSFSLATLALPSVPPPGGSGQPSPGDIG